MAIIVEEEKKQSHVFTVAGWLSFLAIAAAAVYYIFFSSSQAALLPSSGGLSAIAPLTQSVVQPQDVENNATLKAFHTTITAPTSTGPASTTRPNPFLAP